MSLSALTMLGMTVILSATLAALTVAVGYGVLAALVVYALGGSLVLFVLAASALVQEDAFNNY